LSHHSHHCGTNASWSGCRSFKQVSFGSTNSGVIAVFEPRTWTRQNSVVAEAPYTDDSDNLFYDAQNGRVLVIGGGFRPDLQEPGSASPCSPQGQMGGLDVLIRDAHGHVGFVCKRWVGI
jgi:hypothetical protein